jgi:CDP-2,3-bis-(O-geranylgeranyl)-sn-glycerol synthase
MELKLFLLIILANGLPIVSQNLLGSRFAQPLDNNRLYFDGKPILGPRKTYRGIISALVGTTLIAVLINLSFSAGVLIASCAMAGDLLSSFIKRRLGYASSDMAFGLDQIPESLFPLLAYYYFWNGLEWLTIVSMVVAFIIVELVISKILYKMRIRNRPY